MILVPVLVSIGLIAFYLSGTIGGTTLAAYVVILVLLRHLEV